MAPFNQYIDLAPDAATQNTIGVGQSSAANRVLAGPASSGAAPTIATFRALTNADLPTSPILLTPTFTGYRGAFRTVASSATLSATDVYVNANAGSSGLSINLAPVGDVGSGYTVFVLKTDPTNNVVTIVAPSTSLINGATTKALSAQFATATLVCDGTSGYWVY